MNAEALLQMCVKFGPEDKEAVELIKEESELELQSMVVIFPNIGSLSQRDVKLT